ncbi:hypothetical protein GX408_07015 [bacterium]|nr:hypothetical protein [bacterium]
MARLLNDAQKTSLRVTLRLIEERLLLLKIFIEKEKIEGSVYCFWADVPAETIALLERRIDQILETVREIAETFALHKKIDKLSDRLRATGSYFETLLIDQYAGKLVRYGMVAPELEQTLDPLLTKLREQIRTFEQKFERD